MRRTDVNAIEHPSSQPEDADVSSVFVACGRCTYIGAPSAQTGRNGRARCNECDYALPSSEGGDAEAADTTLVRCNKSEAAGPDLDFRADFAECARVLHKHGGLSLIPHAH